MRRVLRTVHLRFSLPPCLPPPLSESLPLFAVPLYQLESTLIILMSSSRARELRSLRSTDRAPSPPKYAPGGRKRLQSNADEVIPKRSKTANRDNDEDDDDDLEQQPVKKAATKSKGKKGKNTRFVMVAYRTYQLTTLQ